MIQTSKTEASQNGRKRFQKRKISRDKLSLTKQHKEENNMFAAFATKVAAKVVPKLIANPVLAVEMAPVLVAAGAAVAIYDLVNQ